MSIETTITTLKSHYDSLNRKIEYLSDENEKLRDGAVLIGTPELTIRRFFNSFDASYRNTHNYCEVGNFEGETVCASKFKSFCDEVKSEIEDIEEDKNKLIKKMAEKDDKIKELAEIIKICLWVICFSFSLAIAGWAL